MQAQRLGSNYFSTKNDTNTSKTRMIAPLKACKFKVYQLLQTEYLLVLEQEKQNKTQGKT